MITADNRWEFGSFWHWLPTNETAIAAHPWGEDYVMCGSGRDAFIAIIKHGMAQRGWKRLYSPCYYCQEVVWSLVSTGIEVCLYQDGPQHPSPRVDNIDFKPGDVLLRVDYFGLRGPMHTDTPFGVEVIDDYTHDPWSQGAWQSDADWCVASLRKTLPIPDGGMLWSPHGHHLPSPPEVTSELRLLSLEKLAAMVLKTEYLEGKPILKPTFFGLSEASAARVGRGPASGMTEWSKELLPTMPVAAWRQQRQVNHQAFCERLADVKWLKVLQVSDSAKTCAFSAITWPSSIELRNYLREKLIANNVYPTTMWPLEELVIPNVPSKYIDFSIGMLSIQCDARYDAAEMQNVADMIRAFGEEFFADRNAALNANKRTVAAEGSLVP